MRNIKNIKEKGFTLIELLVVIAIIGILSGVLFVAINPKEQSDKAKAAKIANDLRLIEKAFRLTSIESNWNGEFPTESELGLGSNPTIETLVNNDKLKYINSKIKPDLGNKIYFYDNDGDIANLNCDHSSWANGVNITIINITNTNIVNILDNIFDNGNGKGCGKIRWSGSAMTYNLSTNK